jgi:hypothetical protein
MSHGELELWEPLIRLYEHREGEASYSLKLDVSLPSGLTQEVLVELSETELRISCAIDSERAALVDQFLGINNSEFKLFESGGAFRLTQSINHLDEAWDLFTDFDGQLGSLAFHAAAINGDLETNEGEYEHITRQEVESMFNITLTDSQWRTICAEMEEQPDEEHINEFPTFLSVLQDVVKNIDVYEKDWIFWDKELKQTTSQALERYEPNSTKRK